MYQQHLTNCTEFEEYLRFYTLPDIDTELIDHNEQWIHLQYSEAFYIKTMSPETNIGLKAPKEF